MALTLLPPGSTYPRLELTPPPVATTPPGRRLKGADPYSAKRIYMFTLFVHVCARAIYTTLRLHNLSFSFSFSLSLSLSLARSIARSRSSVSCSRTARTYAGVYAGISQRAANLWSREARFNPLRLVSGYSFRLRPASDGTLIRSPRLSESARSLSS